MATFRQRQGKWEVRVRRKGHDPLCRFFNTKQEGEKWARSIETDMDKGSYVNTTFAENTTLKEVIERYIPKLHQLCVGAKDDSIRLSKANCNVMPHYIFRTEYGNKATDR